MKKHNTPLRGSLALNCFPTTKVTFFLCFVLFHFSDVCMGLYNHNYMRAKHAAARAMYVLSARGLLIGACNSCENIFLVTPRQNEGVCSVLPTAVPPMQRAEEWGDGVSVASAAVAARRWRQFHLRGSSFSKFLESL
jgi:hypothetical protein